MTGNNIIEISSIHQNLLDLSKCCTNFVPPSIEIMILLISAPQEQRDCQVSKMGYEGSLESDQTHEATKTCIVHGFRKFKNDFCVPFWRL